MDLFCTDVEWLALKRTERRRTAAFLIPALLTPVLFVTLCLLIRTGNARVMHAALLGTTGVLGGCAVAVYLLLLRPARQELKHLEMLRTGEKTYPEGRLTVTGDVFLYTENENAPEPYRLYLGARSPIWRTEWRRRPRRR